MAIVFNPFWFDWGALATGLTGAAAVWAARSVGLRQAAISKKQVEQGSVSIRIALFERRVAIYDATDAFMQCVLSPPSPTRNDGETFRAFWKATSEAEHLFSPEFADRLREIGQAFVGFLAGNGLRPAGTEGTAANHSALSDGYWQERAKLQECWESLPDMFGPYLRIEEPGV